MWCHSILCDVIHILCYVIHVLCDVIHVFHYSVAVYDLLSGESGVHLAIVYNEIDLFKLLMSNGASVNQRASGRFFLPDDQKNNRRQHPLTDYIGLCFHKNNRVARIKSAEGVYYYQWYVQHNQWDKTGPTPTPCSVSYTYRQINYI